MDLTQGQAIDRGLTELISGVLSAGTQCPRHPVTLPALGSKREIVSARGDPACKGAVGMH